jgi:cellulose biosynthesis protein BcsQ
MSWLNHLTKFSNESYKHFVAKAILFYLLRKMKHNVATEWRVPNGYIDIVDKDTMTFYEIETSHSPKYRSRKLEQYDLKGYDIIIVDCSKLPSDIDEIHEYLKQFIVED